VIGTFVLSLDTELIWGSFDHMPDGEFARRYPDIRGTIERILALLDRYEIPTTWAVVGHLLLDECQRGPDGRAHPDMPRPAHRWYAGDWYGRDPCSTLDRDPLWYGRDVVEGIRAARTAHELGCHGFSHALFGDPGCPVDVADAELAACVALANQLGISLTSFAFPRNREGHHARLVAHGFDAYRGADPTWYRDVPKLIGRAAHLADNLLALEPPVTQPFERLPGLWNIPGSMLLLHRVGVRRLVTVEARIAKARRGLRAAADTGRVFHLWTHPFNLAHDRPAMLRALDGILAEAARLRDAGRLEVRTMRALRSHLAAPAADRESRIADSRIADP
jgi:peptidoglycan/xylan/chitin deacetylase (PgdA/CDA1 family)